MAHISGRTVKNVEAPRPLKSQSRSSLKSNFMVIEELIQLIESVALTLQSGNNNTEPMATLVQNLRMHGPQLEQVSKDTLDRAFVVFRNASQDERLNIMTRLHLLELIELRAKGWEDSGLNAYYKTKQAHELPEVQQHHMVDATQQTAGTFISTSPTFGGGANVIATVSTSNNAAAAAAAANVAAIATVGSAQQQHLLLAPGEVIRNSGKFQKPTKIPGKNYCKDEVVIRNADSGKVNPGAKERLVQITGPAEEKIYYAKQLIEDTIRRNASPVRLEPAHTNAATGGGSCSSLASSNSDELVQPRTPGGSGGGGSGHSNLSNRLSFNSSQKFMTAQAAAQQIATTQVQHQQQHHQQQQQQHHHHHHSQQPHMSHIQQQQNVLNNITPLPLTSTPINSGVGKLLRPNQQMLLHSFSTNDASLGEYKYTVAVGHHVLKITGDSCDLVRYAKLMLDDHFNSTEFLTSVEAGALFDASMVSPSTPIGGPPQFMMGTPLHAATAPLIDSGVGLNYMASNSTNDGDDEVFSEANASNGLVRSRRSHFSRKESTPDTTEQVVMRPNKTENSNTNIEPARIVIEYEHLLYYAKSPHSWALPADWLKICEKFPAIVRNKDLQDESNRFDGEKYMELVKSASKRNIAISTDETTNDTDPNVDNE